MHHQWLSVTITCLQTQNGWTHSNAWYVCELRAQNSDSHIIISVNKSLSTALFSFQMADESHHRDVNHTFADMGANDPNPFINTHRGKIRQSNIRTVSHADVRYSALDHKSFASNDSVIYQNHSHLKSRLSGLVTQE